MLTKREAAQWLKLFGYLESLTPDSNEFAAAVKEMQRTYGLKVDGDCGPITSRAMGLYRCGCPDRKTIRAGEGDCKWQKSKVTYYYSPSLRLSNLTLAQTHEMIEEGVRLWQPHLNVKLEKAKTRTTADFTIGQAAGASAGFDGPGNVLAWAYLPCDDRDVQLSMMFDSAEPWAADVRSQAGVYALAVFCHELGHILGLDHSTTAADLMAPYYNPQIWAPQAGDVRRVQRLYGAVGSSPTPTPEPGPSPPVGLPPGKYSGTGELTVTKDAARLTWTAKTS